MLACFGMSEGGLYIMLFCIFSMFFLRRIFYLSQKLSVVEKIPDPLLSALMLAGAAVALDQPTNCFRSCENDCGP